MAKEELQAAIAKHGLAVTSEFVPFSKSRNAEPQEDGKVWRSLNWKVTLQCAGNPILTTDYSAGEGHAPASKASVQRLGSRNSVMRHEAITHEIETGFSSGTFRQAITPDPVDVIRSLVSDADVLDCSTFEEWADNIGCDKDSRKAEATYRECLALALKLRNGIGEAALAELREAAQDY